MPDDVLKVWYRDRLVGRLTSREVGSGFEFVYDSHWAANGFRLSVSLPLRTEPFLPNDSGTRFFGNLVPEGNQRERWVRELKIADTDFALLKALGRDCAGAFSILPEDVKPSLDGGYDVLTNKELAGYCLRKGKPGEIEKTPIRFSLAGYQEKLPIHEIGGKYYLPQGAAASSKLLKFEVPEFANVPLYEAFLAHLYQRAGLNTCETEYREESKAPYIKIQRFDRYLNGDTVERLHQEDFCQALGYPRSQKYESERGPSYADCVALLRKESALPVEDINRLNKWLVLNVLAGNSDGHSKNLALLQDRNNLNRWRLAQFYDLVCTGAIARVDTKLAFSIGGGSDPNVLTRLHWEREAETCRLNRATLVNLASEWAEKLPAIAKELRTEFEEKQQNVAALQRVIRVVNQRCKRVLLGLMQK